MQNVHEMSRHQVLTELARHAHPSWYQSLVEWQTPQLKALLVYYREGGDFPTNMVGRIHRTKGLGDERRLPCKHGGVVVVEIRRVPRKKLVGLF